MADIRVNTIEVGQLRLTDLSNCAAAGIICPGTRPTEPAPLPSLQPLPQSVCQSYLTRQSSAKNVQRWFYDNDCKLLES